MKEKLHYLDGLRTIFCAVVIIHHFMLAFYPTVPILLFNDGNLAVIYFLMLSGFVLPIKIFNHNVNGENRLRNVVRYAKNRYLRLFPVIFATIISSWAILARGGYCTQAVSELYDLETVGHYFNEKVSVFEMLYEAFLGSFIQRPYLNPPLWTIRYEFIILIFAYFVVDVFHNKKFRMVIYVVCAVIGVFVFQDIYIGCVAMGIVLSDLLFNECTQLRIVNYFKLKLFRNGNEYIYLSIAGILYLLMVFLKKEGPHIRFLCMCFIFLAILISPFLQKVLSKNAIVQLSKYSFEVYVAHWPIMCSFSAFMMLSLEKMGYQIASVITFILTVILILIVAALLKLIEFFIAHTLSIRK